MLGVILEPSWGVLGGLLGRRGGLLGRLEALLGRLGVLLGRLGALLGPSSAVLEPSWGPFGPSWTLGSPKRRAYKKMELFDACRKGFWDSNYGVRFDENKSLAVPWKTAKLGSECVSCAP